MKKTAIFLTASLLFSAWNAQSVFAQTAITTAQLVAKEAAKKDSLADAVTYLKKQIPALSAAAEKRAGYAFLGGVQEQMGLYADAGKSYAAAAAIAAGDAAGMPKKTNEQLVLDAVRCALSTGDAATADSYLGSAVRNSQNATVLAYVKLYEQWSALCKAKKESDITEPLAMLKTYADLYSMNAVAPVVLLTLWHVSGEQSYANALKKDYPSSPEAAIVKGTIQQLPAPFWYFVPRKGSAIPEVEQEPVTYQQSADEKPAPAVATPAPSVSTSSDSAKTADKTDRAVKQQLGLFRDENNAKGLVEQLKKKGFTAKITSEVRPSGTTYYLVVVDENKDGTMGAELRNAGFECYPLFE